MKNKLSNIPIDVTDQILKFRFFLNSCWNYLDELMDDHDWDDDGGFIDDWLEANWEFLIERELLGNTGYIPSFNTRSTTDRITNKEKKPTHIILAKAVSESFDFRTKKRLPENELFRLGGFCTPVDGELGLGLYPPFDYANLVIDKRKEIYYVPIVNLRFFLTEYSNGHK